MLTALISGSLVLLVASAATLALGWSSANEKMILGSMIASVAAGVLLIGAWVASKRKPATESADGAELSVAPPPPPPPPLKRAEKTGQDRSAGRAVGEKVAPPKRRRDAKPSPPSRSRRGVKKPVGKEPVVEEPAVEAAPAAKAPRASKSSAPAPPAAAARQGGIGDVIAIPDRKRFHTPDCRFAKAKGAERMSKASARRRGYVACGICKP